MTCQSRSIRRAAKHIHTAHGDTSTVSASRRHLPSAGACSVQSRPDRLYHWLLQLARSRHASCPVDPSRKSAARRSKLHGFGVFALEPINKNKRIIDYAGELITNKQSESREDRYLRKGCIWVFRVNRNWSRDANVDGNVARFINHSCKPNCWIEVVGQDHLDSRGAQHRAR